MKKSLFLLSCFSFFLLRSQNLWTVYNTGNSPIPDNVIRAIETDSSGNVWVGTDNGLARFDGTNWTVMDSSNSGLPVNQIRSIAFDSANHLWVGTLQAGLSIYNGVNWTNYNTANSLLPDDQVRSITFDAGNIAWLGTGGGVAYLSDEGWIVYNMNNTPLGANNINQIFIDANDTKWIGTVNGGISKKEGNTWTTYNNHNSGLTDNTVLDFDTDIFGNLWFATPAQGLGRYNGSNWYYRLDANSAIPTNSISCLEIVKSTDVKYMGTITSGLLRWNNGLVFDSFTVNNSPMPDNHVTCIKRTHDGKIWIGTATGGVAVFNDTTSFALVNAVDEINSVDAIAVYPNPVREELTVAGCRLPVETAVVFDVYGKEVIRQSAFNNQHLGMDVSSLAAGVYVLQVKGKNYSVVKKFIKQ